MNLPILRAACQALGGIGLGLSLWMGLSSGLLLTRGIVPSQLRAFPLVTLALALVLTAAAFVAMPTTVDGLARIWKPRTRILLLACLACTAALLALVTMPRPDPGWIAVAGLLACLSAFAAIAALAVSCHDGPGSLGNALPAQLALALLGGAAWLMVLMGEFWAGPMSAGMALPLLMLALLATITVATPWWTGGGLRHREGQTARWTILALLLPVPLLAIIVAGAWPGLGRPAYGLAAAAITAALVLERLLECAPAQLPGRLAPHGE